MRVLSVHNSYKIRGGEDESREAEERLLCQHGHQVEVYEESNNQLEAIAPLTRAIDTIWSTRAYYTVQEIVQRSACDLMHVQNFFPQISPSVYYAAKSKGVPVVQTLRNYRLLCPNALFFREGQVCEDCLGKAIPYPGMLHRCYRDSLAASSVTTAMITVHRLLKTWSEQVDIFIALTEFARQKFIQGGLPAEKIVVKPNFVAPDPGVGDGLGGYALFVGRLSAEKGLDTLLAAWEHLNYAIPLKIVGEGPLADRVSEIARRCPKVEWLGRRSISEVHALMGDATVLIFPSKWYETFGRVAVEAFAKGTPVIAAQIGAIAELVEHGRTGLQFRPGDPTDLAATVNALLSQPKQLAAMREAARAEFEQHYTAEQNYHRLMQIYDLACDQANGRRQKTEAKN